MPSHDRPLTHSRKDRDDSSGDRRMDFGLLLAGTALALTVVRWLLPTEATAEGETLWIAVLWLALGGVSALSKFRSPGLRRFDGVDLAATLLIGGHVISGCVVLADGGNHRAALNLIWEWLSLGSFWIVWREVLRSSRWRAALVQVMLATAVMAAAWGLWQYFVWYPDIQAKYGPKFDQLKQLETIGGDANVLRRELHDAGIPFEGAAREQFENRLRNSREPFGPFALANTFGGLLAAWFVLGCVLLFAGLQQFLHQPRDQGEVTNRISISRYAIPGSMLGVIAVCLYLTNSRTAWGGAIVAGLACGVWIINRRIGSTRLRLVVTGVCSVGAFLAALALLWVVLRDEQLVPGPLKSLAYRAEYWEGTWRLLKTTPWLGTGPGQFRDGYLQFKLPETSEEIADPHNLILDVWANGGILALVGLAGLLIALLRRVWQLVTAGRPSTTEVFPFVSLTDVLPGLAGFGVAIVGQLVTLGYWDSQLDHLAMFSPVWLLAAWLLVKCLPLSERGVAFAGSLAGLALSVHLCGAGGIAMPAVTQLWLLLILLNRPLLSLNPGQVAEGTEANRAEGAPLAVRRGIRALFAVASFAAAIGCVWTSYWPTTQARHFLEAADLAASQRGNPDRVAGLYQQAAAADSLAWEPWERLAHWEFSRAVAPQFDRTRFESAVQSADEVIRRSPNRFRSYQQLAEFWKEAARVSRSADDWNAAIEAYQAAVVRHPTNAQLTGELAIALDDADRPSEATEFARRAIVQDDLNHQRGHTDRYLPEKLRQRLLKVAEINRGPAEDQH